MRETKFRVWNKKLNLMKTVERIYFNENKIQVRDGFIYDDSCEWFFEDCELMQFTGQKDKNGKEIYESDLVFCEGWKPKEIVWLEKISGYGLKETGLWLSEFYALDMKVIGNIYEKHHELDK